MLRAGRVGNRSPARPGPDGRVPQLGCPDARKGVPGAGRPGRRARGGTARVYSFCRYFLQFYVISRTCEEIETVYIFAFSRFHTVSLAKHLHRLQEYILAKF